jgi:cobalt/nickel transport system permease protein
MHIPDGFLSLSVSSIFWLITVLVLTLAVRRTRQVLDDRQVPLMGVMAACIFAAQMLNFPVAGGTSGHLLGGALATIVLGPSAGILVMACVVALQALLFQDGGIVVMGANIFNMGIVTAVAGGAIFYGLLSLAGRWRWGLVVSGFIAAMVSVVASAFVTSLQLIASGTAQAQVVITAMTLVHILIGIGEGLITATALSFLLATRRDLLPAMVTARLEGGSRTLSGRGVLVRGLVVAALLALLSPLASSAPDGLERVAIDLGFIDGGSGPGMTSPAGVLPDYTIPGLGGALSTILAGLIGILIVVAIGYGVALLLRRRSAQRGVNGSGSVASRV